VTPPQGAPVPPAGRAASAPFGARPPKALDHRREFEEKHRTRR